MWPDVAKFMGVAATENADDAQPPTSIYAVRELVSRPEVFYTGQISRAGSIVNANVHDQKNPFLARVALTRELFAASSRRHCVHVEIDLTGSLLTYEAGDHLAIYPINPKTEAEKLARALGLWDKKDTFVMIEAVDATAAKKHPFPVPSTYDTILRHYLDITRVPTRDLLAILASFFPAGSPARAHLAKLALDKLEHERVCVHDRLMLGEILQIVETMEGGAGLKDLPLFPAIVEGLGRLQPRYYSISSSPKLYPKMVHVTASVLQYNSLVKPERTLYGICTNYLLAIHDMLSKGELAEDTEQHALYSLQPAGMKVEDVPHREVRIPVFLRRSNFKLPSDPKLPIIMVGPGTGVAPFRGFIQERQWQRRQGIEVGPTLLFFGCRRSDEDYLYREEWLEAMGEINPESYTYTSPALPSARPRKGRDAETGASKASDNGDGLAVSENKAADAAVFVAFSREDPQHKHYVQHRLAEMGARVWTLLGPGGGSFYVCGDAKYMAHDVHATLKSIASTEGGMSAEDAEKWVKDLRAMGRYMEDVWA
ncbi:MAG: hypothetical protein BJ554DRAFT_5561 [Olpidium bornovanus]|uniref:NADPH--hemoprotein reductase n=1 Tax=Olpidium bornovanus TaxID=278681 RepID=A0A8H8DLE3_9FUNG|nr:MAG: hypothetical protein BJ554DRAFT_5561 [Olpidium bornovanus]